MSDLLKTFSVPLQRGVREGQGPAGGDAERGGRPQDDALAGHGQAAQQHRVQEAVPRDALAVQDARQPARVPAGQEEPGSGLRQQLPHTAPRLHLRP